MAKVWRIKGWNDTELIFDQPMPGRLSEKAIAAILQRLACRHLSGEEIIDASRRPRDPGYRPLLERVGSGAPMTYGDNPFYTADFVDE